MLPEIVCPESTPAEYDPPVPQSRMSPPVVAWLRFITVWPVDDPLALTPKANEVLLFDEFALVIVIGVDRLAVEVPAKDVPPTACGNLRLGAPVSADKSTNPDAPDFKVWAVESIVKSPLPVVGAAPAPPPCTIALTANAAELATWLELDPYSTPPEVREVR
jgi:hypothetical protein